MIVHMGVTRLAVSQLTPLKADEGPVTVCQIAGICLGTMDMTHNVETLVIMSLCQWARTVRRLSHNFAIGAE